MPGQKREAVVVLSKMNGDFPLLWLVLHTSCSLEPPPWSLAQSTTAHCGLRWVEAWEAAKRPGVLGDCLPAKSSTLLPAPWTSAPAPLPSSSWPSPCGSRHAEAPSHAASFHLQLQAAPKAGSLLQDRPVGLAAGAAITSQAEGIACPLPLTPAACRTATCTSHQRCPLSLPLPSFACDLVLLLLFRFGHSSRSRAKNTQHTQASSAPHPRFPKPAGASVSNLCRESRPPSSFLPSLLLPGLARKLSYSHLDPT